MITEYVRDTVVLGKPLIDEGLVRRHQLKHTVVLTYLALEKQLHLSRHRHTQVSVEVGERVRIGRDQLHVPQIEPLPTEVVD